MLNDILGQINDLMYTYLLLFLLLGTGLYFQSVHGLRRCV